MYTPPKPKYSPEKLYKSDINDLVEDSMEKGGPGSGKKGHKTIRDRLLGHKYHVESEDATHYHARDKHGEKVKVNRTQAEEVDEAKESSKTKNVHGSDWDSFHKPSRPYNSDAKKEYKETDRRSPGKKITDGMHYSERKKYEEKK